MGCQKKTILLFFYERSNPGSETGTHPMDPGGPPPPPPPSGLKSKLPNKFMKCYPFLPLTNVLHRIPEHHDYLVFCFSARFARITT